MEEVGFSRVRLPQRVGGRKLDSLHRLGDAAPSGVAAVTEQAWDVVAGGPALDTVPAWPPLAWLRGSDAR
jgi:hypothetical protein